MKLFGGHSVARTQAAESSCERQDKVTQKGSHNLVENNNNNKKNDFLDPQRTDEQEIQFWKLETENRKVKLQIVRRKI